jgi:mono/diheme cytochrome c family protein
MKKLIVIFVALALAGCFRDLPKDKPPLKLETNMFQQPRYEPQSESEFFADGATMRIPPEGTVARGEFNDDVAYFTGKDEKGQLVARIPVPVTMPLLKRGQERFDIFCSPCHGRLGDGQGMVVKRGMIPPPTFHDDRLRNIQDGHIFDVMTNGIRNMPPYRYQIPVADRWAIVAYFRALQRSQHATDTDLTDEDRAKLRQEKRQ